MFMLAVQGLGWRDLPVYASHLGLLLPSARLPDGVPVLG